MYDFWLSFFAIFMAVNAIGVLPMFITLTLELEKRKVRRVIMETVITASAVALIFLVAGTVLFRLLGITVADFMVAGGVLIFIIALNDLLAVEAGPHQVDPESMGAVPLGVPLIVGPAVLTTIMILLPEHGYAIVMAATIVNILIAGLLMWFSLPIIGFLGKSGARAIAKVSDLILAAIAVMMVRRGIELFLSGFRPSM